MDIVCIIDKSKADELWAKGFKYTECKVSNGVIYQFIKNPELDNYLNSNYSNRDFFINKYFNF